MEEPKKPMPPCPNSECKSYGSSSRVSPRAIYGRGRTLYYCRECGRTFSGRPALSRGLWMDEEKLRKSIPSLISGERKGKVARRAGVSSDCMRRLGHRLDAVMEEQIGRMLEEICCPGDMMEEALEYFLGRLRKRLKARKVSARR